MNRPKLPKLNPKAFLAFCKESLDYIDYNRPVSGLGTQVYASPGGRVVNAQPGGVSSSNEILHPFQTTLRINPANPNQTQAKVFLGSNLYAGIGNWSNIAIIGLDAWFVVSENDYIYLTGTYIDGELDEVNVDSGSALPGRTVITTGDEPEQSSWTVRISRIVSDGSSGLSVETNLFQHLTLFNECSGSVPVVYPMPVS